MISSDVLEGVPLLVLANKQDVPVLSDLSHLMQIHLKTTLSLCFELQSQVWCP